MKHITIPYDVHESDQEIVIIIPFGGVQKDSIELKIKHEILTITGIRPKPILRKDFHIIQQQCFWWPIHVEINLPPQINYKNLTSSLSKENILSIIIPKNLIPEHIPVQIEAE